MSTVAENQRELAEMGSIPPVEITAASLPAKNLVTKLTEACAAVDFVPKKGHNERQDYDYMKAADVARALRGEFFSRNILLLCNEKDYKILRTVRTNSGGEMCVGLLHCDYTFVDGDSMETLGPFGAFGEGMDAGDKALNKCKTAALKYVLRGIGLIPDEQAEAEADAKVDEFLARPHVSTLVQGTKVDFDPQYNQVQPSDYADSMLLDAPPKPQRAPGGCKLCGGKVQPAGVGKRTGKPYPAFCKDCKATQ